MPNPRANFAAVAVDGQIYVMGGRDGTDLPVIATMDVYDPSINTWLPRTPMPTPRRSHAAVAVGERIYVMGG